MDNKLDLTNGGAWALMATWLTPKILFCFLNITIATIFLSSNFKSRNKRQYQNDAAVEHHQYNRSLARSPSLLQRVGSFDFSFFSHHPETAHQVQYAPPQPTQLQRSPSLLDRIKSFDFSVLPAATNNQEESSTHKDPPQVKRVPSMLERVKSIKLSLYTSHVTDPVSDDEDHHVERSKSAGAGKVSREKLAPGKKMKKSASVKPRSLSEKRVEDVEERRPATTSPVESASLVDEEVDAKADDFINRFRQQLKLQRLDSLLRFRETLNKGGPTGSTK